MKISGRSKRILLLLSCFFQVIKYGKANTKPEKINKVIVAVTGKLGDIVCTTPVLKAIRQYLPNIRVVVAGNSKLNEAILADSNLADEYIDLSGENAVEKIRLCKADVALVTGPSFLYAALMCGAGVPLVVAPTVTGGFSPAETRLYKILKKFVKTFPYHIGKYAPRERLKVLESIGIFHEGTTKHLGFSEKAKIKIDKFFSEKNLSSGNELVIGISPSAGNKIKEWPEDRFAKVADHLISNYNAKVVLIGGPTDSQKIMSVSEKITSGYSQVVQVSDLNIDELKALISKLDLFISVDTGPIYIAEAFDVPTIDIVGPVDEKVQPPQGPRHRSVVPPDRRNSQLSVLNARSYDTEEAAKQVLSITIDMVNKEIDDLIKGIIENKKNG